MTSWRSANKTVCVACDLGTEVVDETHTHTIGSLDPEFGQNCNRMKLQRIWNWYNTEILEGFLFHV